MSTRLSRLAEQARSWQQKRGHQAYVGNKAEQFGSLLVGGTSGGRS